MPLYHYHLNVYFIDILDRSYEVFQYMAILKEKSILDKKIHKFIGIAVKGFHTLSESFPKRHTEK